MDTEPIQRQLAEADTATVTTGSPTDTPVCPILDKLAASSEQIPSLFTREGATALLQRARLRAEQRSWDRSMDEAVLAYRRAIAQSAQHGFAHVINR